MTAPSVSRKKTCRVALIGNPNSGKTTLFNAVTGLHHKVANYPGVTVEQRTGYWETPHATVELTDLPGCYSLIAHSPDEAIASDWLYGRRGQAPEAIICTVDVTNITRHLYLVGQIIDLGRPVIVALTMGDEAKRIGLSVDVEKLSKHLGVPVVEIVAPEKEGLNRLATVLDETLSAPWTPPPRPYHLPPALEDRLQSSLPETGANDLQTLACICGLHTPACTEQLEKVARRLRTELGIDEETVRRFVVEARYSWQRNVSRDVVRRFGKASSEWTRRLDNILLHRIAGPIILMIALGLIFQAIFTWATGPMNALGYITGTLLPSLTNRILAPGPLQSLINNGIYAGVGSVITFLPQILLLFFFLSLLEDSGYLARAAFLLDRLMSKVGLSGRSFIPLLSSFACAIPGIMATRTIPNRRDRLATILVAPLLTCSARLVVYTFMIAAFVPDIPLWGPFNLQGVTLLGLYLLGIVSAATMAAFFRKSILRGPAPPLLMELPPYRKPRLHTLAITLWERARIFLVTAGTIIFAASIILWGLSSYPRWDRIEREYHAERQELMTQPAGPERTNALRALEGKVAADRLQHSFAGYVGRIIEPVIAPLGFDWKMGIGILGSFAAREVFVSTMGVVYGVGSSAKDQTLVEELHADRDPQTGRLVWTPLIAITLLVFYAYALQCISTIAIIRRETNSWRWPLFAIGYLTILAYGAALLTRFVGSRFL